MPVRFFYHKAHNLKPPLPVEEVFRLFAAWAGLHDFSFDQAYTPSGGGWSGTATASFASGVLTVGTGPYEEGWHYTVQSHTILPPSHTIRFRKEAGRMGVVIGANEGFHYLVTVNESGYPEIYHFSGNGYTLLQSIPKATPEVADVEVVFRQYRFTEVASDVWRSISLYMNGELITTYTHGATSIIASPQFGFAGYGGENVSYSNIDIPELCEIAEWGTLDIGETAASALGRAIEGRNLKYFVRWNGQFRAWRPKSVPISFVLDESDGIIEGDVSVDTTNLKTHIRMLGAWVWAEAINEELLKLYGHTFEEQNNHMLFTEDECYAEAQRALKRQEEAAITEPLQTFNLVLLEPEDRIQTPHGDWLVTEMSQEYRSSSVIQQLLLRKYVWD